MTDQAAYDNNAPWMGLGADVSQAKTMKARLKQAGLDWTVDRVALKTASGEDIDGFAGLQRSDTGQVLDVVGRVYQPTQNHEGMEFFNEYLERGDAKMETMGSLRDGRMVWGLASLGNKFTLRGHDVVNAYLLVILPHKKGKSNIIALTPVRSSCMNTIRLWLSSVRITHRRAFTKAVIAEAKATIGIAREKFDEFGATAVELQKTAMTRKDAFKVFKKITGDNANNEDEAGRVTRQLLDVLDHAPGAQPDNAWGVLNAVTYYADHVASRTPDKRLTNAWMGKGQVMKQRALNALLA